MKPECYHAPCQWSADACAGCPYDMDCYERFDSTLFKGVKTNDCKRTEKGSRNNS